MAGPQRTRTEGMRTAFSGGRSLSRENSGKKEILHKTTLSHSRQSLCGGGVPSSHPSHGLSVFFLFFFSQQTGSTQVRTGAWKEREKAHGKQELSAFRKLKVLGCGDPLVSSGLPETLTKAKLPAGAGVEP